MASLTADLCTKARVQDNIIDIPKKECPNFYLN